ncbi:MAG TPA: hypothetical protein VFQ67_11205 [Allosphingosinicella sp.]|nr:hypothetical protein [Allosphingosinicella sp.]
MFYIRNGPNRGPPGVETSRDDACQSASLARADPIDASGFALLHGRDEPEDILILAPATDAPAPALIGFGDPDLRTGLDDGPHA